jgi:hypothetical protein
MRMRPVCDVLLQQRGPVACEPAASHSGRRLRWLLWLAVPCNAGPAAALQLRDDTVEPAPRPWDLPPFSLCCPGRPPAAGRP